MIQVEIEGIAPNTVIDVGETRVVARTAMIDNMRRGGFIKINRFVPAKAREILPPLKSARKSDWSDFLAEQGVKTLGDETKDQLIALWETRAV